MKIALNLFFLAESFCIGFLLLRRIKSFSNLHFKNYKFVEKKCAVIYINVLDYFSVIKTVYVYLVHRHEI